VLTTCAVCGREGLLVIDGDPRPHIAWNVTSAPYVWCVGDRREPPTFTSPPPLRLLADWRIAERVEAAA